MSTTTCTASDGQDEATVVNDEHLETLLDTFYSFMYEKAVLIGPAKANASKSKKKETGAKSPIRGSSPTHDTAGRFIATSLPVHTSASSMSTSTVTREIMDALLPPKAWQDAQDKWQRVVRTQPAARIVTQRLREAFGQLLEQYQARLQPICHVREKFYRQIFDELIREVACECPERGLMLLRVRDELRLTVEAYQTIYHNSLSYGRQKAVEADSDVSALENDICRLKAKRERLETTKNELTYKVRLLEEQLNEDEKKRRLCHAHTMHFLRTQNQELNNFQREMTQDVVLEY